MSGTGDLMPLIFLVDHDDSLVPAIFAFHSIPSTWEAFVYWEQLLNQSDNFGTVGGEVAQFV
jgi:hypothetical protein